MTFEKITGFQNSNFVFVWVCVGGGNGGEEAMLVFGRGVCVGCVHTGV